MRFLLRVTEDGGGGYDRWSGEVLVQMDADDIKAIFERKELLQMVQSKASDLDETHYWSWCQTHWSDSFDTSALLSESELKEFEREGTVRVPDERVTDGIVSDDDGGDCEAIVLDSRGIRFSCYINGGDTRVSSDYVLYDRLLAGL